MNGECQTLWNPKCTTIEIYNFYFTIAQHSNISCIRTFLINIISGFSVHYTPCTTFAWYLLLHLSTMAGATYGAGTAYPFWVFPCYLMGSMFFIFCFLCVFFPFMLTTTVGTGGRRVRDRMVVEFTGRIFSRITPLSTNNKTDRHDTTEIFFESGVTHHSPTHIGTFMKTLYEFAFDP